MNDNPATLLCSLPMAAVGRVFCFHPPSGKGTESGSPLPPKVQKPPVYAMESRKKRRFRRFSKKGLDKP